MTEILSWEPRVVLYKGFVTREEIAHIERLAEDTTRSKVVTDNASDTIQRADVGWRLFQRLSPHGRDQRARGEGRQRHELPAHFGEDFYPRYKKGRGTSPPTTATARSSRGCRRAPA